MKRIVLLGASGSIGKQTLDVIRQHPDEYRLVSFGVGKNIYAAREILREFPCACIAVQEEADQQQLQQEYPDVEVLCGKEGLIKLAQLEEYDLLVNALVGFAGLEPTLAAIQKGHDIALANKETLVVGGELIQKAWKEHHVHIFPIDSEHSAIFQCLQGSYKSEIKRLIITASGGSFRNRTREELEDVTVAEALAHPNWSMGEKITIDSATMMNKGFEVMEAHYLFEIPYEQIHVLMHDESIIHSMIEFQDNAVLAQLGTPDMRIPIQYALRYPHRDCLSDTEPLDLAKVGTLHFKEPDLERYPLLALAYEVGRRKGNLPAVMNGANEEANLAFRQGRLSFLQIEDAVINAVYLAEYKEVVGIQDLIDADKWGREYVHRFIESEAQE